MRQPIPSFGLRAAQIGLFAPLIIVPIAAAGFIRGIPPDATLVIGYINEMLLGASLLLSLIALVSMSRFGRRGILGRGVAGVVLSAAALTAVAMLVPLFVIGQARRQLRAHWMLLGNPAARDQIEMTFAKDGTFLYQRTANGEDLGTAAGRWTMDDGRSVSISYDHPDPATPAKPIALGAFRHVDDWSMTLTGDMGEETYRRVGDAPDHVEMSPPQKPTLARARAAFNTNLKRLVHGADPVPKPPPDLFQLVKYPSDIGDLAAYLSVDPHDGKRHPAIVWLVGDPGNGIGEEVWTPAPSEQDQSASAFRTAGLIMMYPSLRGGNENPGFRESFLGEVDDVLSAANFLAKQSFVDPDRIYLGGHSTGGTLAMLAVESTDRFRAVFSFEPVGRVGDYPTRMLAFDTEDTKELALRNPDFWLDQIHRPVFVFGGAEQPSNAPSFRRLEQANHNPSVHFFLLPHVNGLSVLSPVTRIIAVKLMNDTGPTCHVSFSEEELRGATK